MKYKKSLVWLTILILSFCTLSLTPNEAGAQTRKKKTVGKTTAKRKTVVKKAEPQVYTVVGEPLKNDGADTEGTGGGSGIPVLVGSDPSAKPHQSVSSGIINGKAIELIKPPYPPAARAGHASGAVNVQVEIDEQGKVVFANAASGHPLLRQAAGQAARESRFSQTLLEGKSVRVRGVIIYNFVAQ